MSVVTTGRRLDRFLSDLSALVEVLPSPDVKARMDADLAALIEFLQGFRARLNSLPTDEGADQIASTIEAVKDQITEETWRVVRRCASAPAHLVHFDGGRFLGPYESKRSAR